jgi:hypothetical protein
MKLVDQSACGILHFLIARLLFENEQEGSTIPLRALYYLNSAITIGC